MLLITIISLTGCRSAPEVLRLNGETMGTTYSVTAIDPTGELELSAVQGAVDETLARVNAQMSNWDPNSEISRFNAAQTTEPIEISPELYEVIELAQEVHMFSDGQFDLTLGPLIELWGFGERTAESPVPSAEAIEAALAITGQSDTLTLEAAPARLTKAFPETTVYLAAIAKGYGVDAVAATLAGLGVENYLVEIGGDLITAGTNPDGRPWRIGIERPELASQRIEQLVDISGLAMATSGDYRNFFEEDGVRYSHIIDAQTGRPITHSTASVTVLAGDAMSADAWATALLVLGAERGMALSLRLDLAVYFTERDTTSEELAFITRASPAFEALEVAQ
ncbi:MAG: FAD:protein FMN transferase [Pseudomonadota bacterium]